jgi:SAM-dependent methyltransferase
MEKNRSDCSSSNKPQEEYVQSLQSRLSERSNLLEEKHMEAAIDAELIHAPCCHSSSSITAPRQKDDRKNSSTDDDDDGSNMPDDNNNNSSTNEKKNQPIFDDYTNPNAVPNCLSPYVPTSAERIAALVQFVNLQANDVLLDIGCGDGRVCIAATKLTGCRAIGLDVSPLCINMARQVAREEGLLEGSVEFYQTDATVDPNILLASWSENDDDDDGDDDDETVVRLLLSKALPSATVVYLYTYPTLLHKLTPLLARLIQQHKVRAIVTLTYHLPETIAIPDAINVEHHLRLYTKTC